jgi:hypothetical protein
VAVVRQAAWPFEHVIAVRPTTAPGWTELRFTVDVPPDARLRARYAMNPDRWLEDLTHYLAVVFSIVVATDEGETTLLEQRVDAQRRIEDRHWYPVDLDLGRFAGRRATLVFRVQSDGPPSEPLDLTGFANPRLVTVGR